MEAKSIYDRANFFVTAQALFANAFATLVTSSNLIGIFKAFPAIICLTGIALNIAWAYTGHLQEKSIKALDLKDVIYKAAPIILGVAWAGLLVAFSLQAFGIIKIL
jgi:hypothetical protein